MNTKKNSQFPSLGSGSEIRGNSNLDFNYIIDALPIAFYTTDAKGRITYFNQAAVNLWGRTPELGKDLWCGSWKIYFPDGKPLSLDQCPMALTLKEGVAHDNQRITIERPDSTFRDLNGIPTAHF